MFCVFLTLDLRNEKTVLSKTKVTYQLEYNTTYIDSPYGFLKKYAERSSKMQVWPYFREIISNLSQE